MKNIYTAPYLLWHAVCYSSCTVRASHSAPISPKSERYRAIPPPTWPHCTKPRHPPCRGFVHYGVPPAPERQPGPSCVRIRTQGAQMCENTHVQKKRGARTCLCTVYNILFFMMIFKPSAKTDCGTPFATGKVPYGVFPQAPPIPPIGYGQNHHAFPQGKWFTRTKPRHPPCRGFVRCGVRRFRATRATVETARPCRASAALPCPSAGPASSGTSRNVPEPVYGYPPY